MNRNLERNKLKTAIICVCTATIAVGGSLAYLTATDEATNRFTVTKALAIDVIEPNWQESNGSNISPAQTIPKDPQVQNKSDVPVYAIMQVSVPHARIATADADGTVHAAASQDLFTYALNPGWSEHGQGSLSENGECMVHTFLLGEELAPGKTSPALFDAVTLVNAVNGQIDGKELSIDVTGFAVQAEGFDSAADAWSACVNQNG